MSKEDKEKVGEGGGVTFGGTGGGEAEAGGAGATGDEAAGGGAEQVETARAETARAKTAQAGVSLLTPDLEELAQREIAADEVFLRQIKNAKAGDVLGHVTSVNTSHKKGQRKQPLASGEVFIKENYGCENDAHSSSEWHRQVSLLSAESIAKAQSRGLDVKEGDFAENLTVEGFAPYFIPLGTVLRIGNEVELEISQVGKVCHTRCAIYYLAGDCIFPREGIFAVVNHGGAVHVGDEITLVSIGEGTCLKTPQEAIDEVEAARTAGTL